MNWRQYGRNLVIAVDQLANALTGGDPDETISSRAGKRQHSARWAYYLCRALHWIDPGHCKKSIDPTEGKDSAL